MVALSEEYLRGKHVPKNPRAAERWLEQAVERGNLYAAQRLEMLYREGKDISRNPERESHFARRKHELLSTALSQGDLAAKALKAELDIQKAASGAQGESLSESKQKAQKGDPAASFTLGLVYQNGGKGIRPNLKRAFQCFEKAAGAGFPPAMFQVGLYFEQGWGVPRNHEKAMQWYRRAAVAGSPQAMERLQSAGQRD
jgi:hypothetical protein